MFGHILPTTDETHRSRTVLALLALLAALTLTLAAAGPAAAAEVGNDTVSVTSDTGEVYVDATFNGSINDSDAVATVVITDANGTEQVNTTISGNASESVVESWAVEDTDPLGNWSVIVTTDPADPTNTTIVDSVSIGTFSESLVGGGGSGDGSSSDGFGSMFGFPVWMIALAGGLVAVVGYRDGWFDEYL